MFHVNFAPSTGSTARTKGIKNMDFKIYKLNIDIHCNITETQLVQFGLIQEDLHNNLCKNNNNIKSRYLVQI